MTETIILKRPLSTKALFRQIQNRNKIKLGTKMYYPTLIEINFRLGIMRIELIDDKDCSYRLDIKLNSTQGKLVNL